MKEELCLVDSNILVYAHENSDVRKHKKSMSLLEKCWKKEIVLALSLQNLSEFYVVITIKFKNQVDKNVAEEIIKEIIEFDNWIKIKPKETTLIKAIHLSNEYSIEYWDALIAATMIENNITYIYTENVKDFSKIKELKIINPFE
ncbi:PIN domain-containing protein [Candidatus Woesearchaeota archaeon]|nr:PIN domain-containing protein [Candidatus Woesearchaeota archaeon]